MTHTLHIFWLLLIVSSPLAFGAEPRPEFLVKGRVERVDYYDKNVDLAFVRVEQVFHGSPDLVRNTFSVVTADRLFPNFGSGQVIVPKLRVNEVGIWAIKRTPSGELFSISYAIHGKMWPSIQDRDPDFEGLEKWAASFGGTYAERDVPGVKSAPGLGDGTQRVSSQDEHVAKLREKIRAEAETQKTNPPQAAPRPWWLVAGIVLAGLVVAILAAKVLRR